MISRFSSVKSYPNNIFRQFGPTWAFNVSLLNHPIWFGNWREWHWLSVEHTVQDLEAQQMGPQDLSQRHTHWQIIRIKRNHVEDTEECILRFDLRMIQTFSPHCRAYPFLTCCSWSKISDEPCSHFQYRHYKITTYNFSTQRLWKKRKEIPDDTWQGDQLTIRTWSTDRCVGQTAKLRENLQFQAWGRNHSRCKPCNQRRMRFA